MDLNAAYVHNTSGPGIGLRYHAPSTDTIDELYLFIDNHTGTIGNVTMGCDIYNENTQLRPGTTLRDTYTAVAMPGGNDKWVKFTFGTPYTPALGEILWFIVYNLSSVPGTDFPEILTATTHFAGFASNNGPYVGYSHGTGFSSNATLQQEMPWVVKQGSNYWGQPFTQTNATYYTNNQLRRGIVITPDVTVTVDGAIYTGVAAYDALEIYDNVTAPGGTPLHSISLGSTANMTSGDSCGAFNFSPITLTAGSTYKIVLTYGANSQLPNVWQIEDYASYSSLFDTLRGYSPMFGGWGCIDDGASGWTIDKSIMPGLALLVSEFPAAAGGGGPLIGGRLAI